jgi:FdhE protein
MDDISANAELLKEALKVWFGGSTVSSQVKIKKSEPNPIIGSILQATLYPWLTAYASELLPLIKVELWRKQYCPVCGGSPDFAYLEKEKGERWLVCSRCDAQWPFYRLTCPYCTNQEHKDLAFFSDDKGLYRLYVCEKCHRYIKAIDLRKTSEETLLPLERVMTLDMDRQAIEQGYKAED